MKNQNQKKEAMTNSILGLNNKKHVRILNCLKECFQPAYLHYKENPMSIEEMTDYVIERNNLKYTKLEKKFFRDVISNKIFNTLMKKEYPQVQKNGNTILRHNPHYVAGLGWFIANNKAYFYIIQTEKEAMEVHKRALTIIERKKKAEYTRQVNYGEHLKQIEYKKDAEMESIGLEEKAGMEEVKEA